MLRPPGNVEGEAPTGIEPVESWLRSLEPKIRLYAEHFRVVDGADSDRKRTG
jgi:hypothetical protein